MTGFIRLFLMCSLAIFISAPGAMAQKASPSNVNLPADAKKPLGMSGLSPAFTMPGSVRSDDAGDRDADPLQNPIFMKLPKDVQDQIMAEAQSFHDDCTLKTGYAEKHNCECLSVHFMNERLNHPEATGDNIMRSVMLDCVDIASTAGYAYNKCQRMYKGMYKENMDKLCECYARRFSRSYANSPNTNSMAEINLGVSTMSDCRQILSGKMADTNQPSPPSPAEQKNELLNLKP